MSEYYAARLRKAADIDAEYLAFIRTLAQATGNETIADIIALTDAYKAVKGG